MLARATLACLAAALAATPALAIKMDGDDYFDVQQKNPRFIEPYGDESPARYRIGDPREGLEDRRAAEYERLYGRRGDVRVRPYTRY